MEFPVFNGEEARTWIRRCTRYFQMIPIPKEQKVSLASVYMQGRAELWFQGHLEKRGMPTWSELVIIILRRFEDLDYERVVSEFNMLRQETTVHEYLIKFEELESHMLIFNKNLDESFFMMKFISGLKEEIKGYVATMNPTTLDQAIVLARRQENMVSALLRKTTQHQKSIQNEPPFKLQNKGLPYKPSFKPAFQPRNDNPHPRRFLTEAEVRARKGKNLCYKCDEPYSPGHRCKMRQVHMLLIEEEAKTYEEREEALEEVLEEENTIVAVYTMGGGVNSHTLRVNGMVNGKEIHILIDSGSTHYFVDEKVAQVLGCKLEPATPMYVRVANGEKMTSNLICSSFCWEIQGHHFSHPVRILKLGGYDCVLGCDWLSTKNPIGLDFHQLHVTITEDGKKVVLRALTERGDLRTLSAYSLSSLLSKGGHVMKGELYTEPKTLPPERTIEHNIELIQDAIPRKQHHIQICLWAKDRNRKNCEGNLDSGIIRTSQSSFASPVLLVKKKDGGWRLCVDYRYLNKLTIKHNVPIPVIDELLDELHGAKYFSKIDLRSCYFQIRMKQEDIPKTSFITHSGHYEFLVMPFGLCNAPSTFQAPMNHIFELYLIKFVLVFFDDILVYSKEWGLHLTHLRKVLSLLRQHQLYAKQRKCSFAQQQVDYLGHVISVNGVSTDPQKVEWYGVLSKPLTSLLKKDAFKWNPKAEAAFENLKRVMTEAPVLALPNFSKPFIVETDACGKGIGAVLMQEGKPIAYLSKALATKNMGLSTYEKEFLALLLAVTRWKHYLMGNHCIIRTDQKSLKHILDQRVDSILQQKWITKLLGLSYEVQYKKGSDNNCVSMTRKSHRTMLFLPSWVRECETCQRSKHENIPYPGLLQPLPIPSQAWSCISMDFVEGLPPSEGKDSIMVLEGVVHLGRGISRHVFCLPPQSDGQTERVNQCLENNLRCICHQKPKRWAQWLTLAEFWFNTNYHTGLKATPFQALYGYPPHQLTMGPYLQSHHNEVDELIQERGKPYKLTSVALRKQLKLSAKYFGPYKILERIGKVAYKLELPLGAKIHPVFHVSLLKKKIGSKHFPSVNLPEMEDEWPHSSPDQATWEDYKVMAAKFPGFDPWGQGSKKGGRDVVFNSRNAIMVGNRAMKEMSAGHLIEVQIRFGGGFKHLKRNGAVLNDAGFQNAFSSNNTTSNSGRAIKVEDFDRLIKGIEELGDSYVNSEASDVVSRRAEIESSGEPLGDGDLVGSK
ncbi:UNVERIFIED_CONTAM: Retrovirus-related Pol polyprotein from transposon.6 [Sesamum radiatum]|uniref:Retrovirus-related Pol polyprotein from transposon.6 n=1 Tax=Sesamum radiatum TaxID=300843 RepID=A0AAW2Q013_SESRA